VGYQAMERNVRKLAIRRSIAVFPQNCNIPVDIGHIIWFEANTRML
jgi:hypothetical protein